MTYVYFGDYDTVAFEALKAGAELIFAANFPRVGRPVMTRPPSNREKW